jgi:hypothetical protein
VNKEDRGWYPHSTGIPRLGTSGPSVGGWPISWQRQSGRWASNIIASPADAAVEEQGEVSSVRSRKALPCSPLLCGGHPARSRDRFGLRQADLADISPDGFARDRRPVHLAGASGSRQHRVGSSNRQQHQQRGLHQACSFCLTSPRDRGSAVVTLGSRPYALAFPGRTHTTQARVVCEFGRAATVPAASCNGDNNVLLRATTRSRNRAVAVDS